MFEKKETQKEQPMPIAEMESNLKNAIDDLIEESEDQPKIVTQHVSMIITHLAKVTADLRVKKQQGLKNL